MSKTVALEEVLRATHDQSELLRMVGMAPDADGAAKNGSPAMAGRK
jgi:hypothetical protein